MSLQNLKDGLGEYAKDVKLNLGSVLSEEGAPGLNARQIVGIALASTYAARDNGLAAALAAETAADEVLVNAAKAAATIMAMNNIYYRFTHIAGDPDYAKMPAKLRMNVIGSPGVDKVDFELMSLAVSAINGCGMCMESHAAHLLKAGVDKTGVQSCVRIAAVINAAAQARATG